MQTILGATGQIGEELAKELKRSFTADIRVVSRAAKKVNDTDMAFAADLSVKDEVVHAVKGSEVTYFTVGLPMDAALWEQQFPVIFRNVIDACKINGSKLVFFDNTYMYPQDGRVLTEQTPFAPVGRKGRVRQAMAEMLLKEMDTGQIEALICRAPEFYGPGKTQSITNTAIFDAVQKGKKPKVPLSDHTRRSLIWTPDASRATALIGNTPDAYGQTWHLPVDEAPITYRQLMTLVSEVCAKELTYTVVPKFIFRIAALFNTQVKELLELLPRYETDNLFDDEKFRKRFPGFKVTSYRKGIRQILKNR